MRSCCSLKCTIQCSLVLHFRPSILRTAGELGASVFDRSLLTATATVFCLSFCYLNFEQAASNSSSGGSFTATLGVKGLERSAHCVQDGSARLGADLAKLKAFASLVTVKAGVGFLRCQPRPYQLLNSMHSSPPNLSALC